MDSSQAAPRIAEAPARTPTPMLNRALARFQAELPHVLANSRAEVRGDRANYNHDYADLAEISEATLPLLGKHGLAWICEPETRGSETWLYYGLLHESGEERMRSVKLGPAGMAPQQFGSLLTYNRRYLIGCFTGIVADVDDDAGAARNAHDRAAGNRKLGKSKDGDSDTPEPEPDKVAQAIAKSAFTIAGDDTKTVADLENNALKLAERRSKLSTEVDDLFTGEGRIQLGQLIQKAREAIEARGGGQDTAQ